MANGLCDSYCKGCVFCQRENGGGGMLICSYYLTTGIRRPCPAGEGCTVKQTGKKVSKWSYEHHHGWEAAKRKSERSEKEKKQLKKVRKEQNIRTVVCPECGKEFETSYSYKIYCSQLCGGRAKGRKFRERKALEREAARQEAEEKGFIR